MQTTPKANNILGHFFALLGAVVMLAIATWVSASSSEQVKPLDNLAVPRTGHTATALSDGSILITGGRDADGNLVAASEIFDPETQTSSASATLNTARVDHSATVLVDGRVLVAGGTGASGRVVVRGNFRSCQSRRRFPGGRFTHDRSADASYCYAAEQRQRAHRRG